MFFAPEQILLRAPVDKCPLMHGFSFILASFILTKDVPAKPEKSFFFSFFKSRDRKTPKTFKIKTRRKTPRQLGEGRGEEREAQERRAALSSSQPSASKCKGGGGDSAEIEIRHLTRCEEKIGGVRGVMEAGDGLKELIEWMKGRGGC